MLQFGNFGQMLQKGPASLNRDTQKVDTQKTFLLKITDKQSVRLI